MADQKVNSLFVKYHYFLPAIVLSLISLVFIGLSLFFGNTFIELRSDLQKEEETLRSLNSTLQTLENLSLVGLDDEQLLVESALPAEKPIFEVLTNLSRIASNSGIALKELSSKPGSLASESAVTGRAASSSKSQSKKQARPESFKLTVSLEGPYDNMKTFFSMVNEMIPIVALDEVRVTTREESSFSSEVDFLVYWKAREEIKENANAQVNYQAFTEEQESILAEILQKQQL